MTHLGHVHLKVRDVDRAVDFYTDLLHLELEERYDRFAFLSYGEHHHDVALQAVGEEVAGPTPPDAVGLYHAAFEVETTDQLRSVAERLRERDVEITPVDHGISKALYFDDPDGNGLEVYYDTREENDRTDWQGMNERFDPCDL